jgi:EKC/KEOPS complex subunit PCC1/LAGE3
MTSSTDNLPHKVYYFPIPPLHLLTSRSLSIPFPSPLLASQALQILSPDKELKEDLVRRTLSVEQSELHVEFECVSARMTRIAVNAFLESVELVLNSMAELGEYVDAETN